MAIQLAMDIGKSSRQPFIVAGFATSMQPLECISEHGEKMNERYSETNEHSLDLSNKRGESPRAIIRAQVTYLGRLLT